MSNRSSLDQLPSLHELNREFLGFLRSSAAPQLDYLGLPHRARQPLRSASCTVLDAVAALPRALFRLALDVAMKSEVHDPQEQLQDQVYHDMCLSILLSVRNVSQHSVYQARLLFGLEPRTIQQLRMLSLGDVRRLAHAPDLVLCAFKDCDWFWTGLLTETRPEGRQQLALIALQPGVEHEWPLRRAARPVI